MLKNPQKADLDKDGKLSSYEKKRGKAIESNMKQKPIKAVLGIATMGLLGAKYLSKKKKASAKPKDDSENMLPIEKLEGKDQKKTQQQMASKGKMIRGYGAARTSGMGLQDEQLVPGKSLDYYKDLM